MSAGAIVVKFWMKKDTTSHANMEVVQFGNTIPLCQDGLIELHIQHHKESRHRYAENENCPDIAVYDSTIEAPAMIWMCQWPIHGVKMLFVKQPKSKVAWAAELRQMRMRTKYEKQTMREVRKGCSFSV